MIGLRRGSGVVDPNLKLELKFNSQVYTDLAGTVAAGANDYVRAWRSTVGGHLLTQATDAARPQRVSDGLYFDGGDNIAGDISLMNTRAAWTVEWWQYESSASGWQTPFALYNTADIHPAFNGTLFYLWDATTATINGVSISRPLNTWGHNAISFNEQTYRYFRDGILIANSTTLLAAGNVSKLLLQSHTNNSSYMTGKLTDFRIYNIAKYTANFTPPTRSA